ncbi:MAG: hypothetical protein EA355_13870 [Rhodobacteraceae bacterium]|nr:MAG: hypothetical protein EA355_13870 [Paracoccaceae bacterium]
MAFAMPGRDGLLPHPAVALQGAPPYPCGMTGLTPLETCLTEARDGLAPAPAEGRDPVAACGHVLAEDRCLACDLPPAAEALRAGFAVAALDLVCAGAGSPAPLGDPVRVLPGERLPPGADAVLPEDGADAVGGLVEASRSHRPSAPSSRPRSLRPVPAGRRSISRAG